jgi:hypothetical protein
MAVVLTQNLDGCDAVGSDADEGQDTHLRRHTEIVGHVEDRPSRRREFEVARQVLAIAAAEIREAVALSRRRDVVADVTRRAGLVERPVLAGCELHHALGRVAGELADVVDDP